jgi:hypothetical protein
VDRWESRRARRVGGAGGVVRVRSRRRPDLDGLERLEGRELLAYSPLGTSLPDLTVNGYTAPVAAWGQPLTVTVDVHNVGTSTYVEPLSLQPGSVSSADAGPSIVAVYVASNPHSLRGAVPIAGIGVPAVPQNGIVQITQTIVLPARPGGFRPTGPVYLVFVANANDSVLEVNPTNDASAPVPVALGPAVADPVAVAFDVPDSLQPGDTIRPIVAVANAGTANTGPVVVDVVASTQPFVNAGSTVVASYTVPNIPPASVIRPVVPAFGDVGTAVQSNVVTIVGAPVTLPAAPPVYYIGVVINPQNPVVTPPRHGHHHGRVKAENPFMLVHQVGPPVSGEPPAGVVQVATAPPLFPNPITTVPIGSTPQGIFPPLFPVIPANASGATGNNPIPLFQIIGPPGGFGGLGADTPVEITGGGSFAFTSGTFDVTTTTTTTGGGSTTTGGGGKGG